MQLSRNEGGCRCDDRYDAPPRPSNSAAAVFFVWSVVRGQLSVVEVTMQRTTDHGQRTLPIVPLGLWLGALLQFQVQAAVAELADAHGSGPCPRKRVGVQLPPAAFLKFATDSMGTLINTNLR
jgi:hypothetical protein